MEAIITVQIQLLPTPEQASQLETTIRSFNAAASHAATVAFAHKETNRFALHKLTYQHIRTAFGLPADMACSVIGATCGAYKRDKEKQPCFRPLASIPFGHGKNYGFKGQDKVSVQMAPKGRLVVPFVCGERQRQQLKRGKCGEADLCLRNGKWFLLVSLKLPVQTPPVEPEQYLGLDLGVENVCVTSDGTVFSSSGIEKKRLDLFRRKRALGKATKNAKRSTRRRARKAIKRLRGKEARYRADINHIISKRITEDAERTGRGIALEDLKGIRERVRLQRRQRAKHHSWSFGQLRAFIEYKARLARVKVVAVDPRYTSQACSRCGHCEKANRVSQSEFKCRGCGHVAHADINAALNIRAKAEGDRPKGTLR